MRNKYPSDITRDQFGIVKPFLESATKATRPYTYDLYDIFCAILYVLREGCRWRALPHDFPKWEVVCCHYRKWGKKNYTGHDERSAFEKALEELAMPERIINGRSPGPSMLAIDSKSIKNAFTAGEKGYDAGKKISGAKVRLAVDILGLPHGIHATTADFTDRDGAIELAAINAGKFESVETVLADSAYSGESFAHTIKGLVDAKVEVARRNEARMFIVLPKRWIVERSFGWADNCRRLWKGCERHLGTFCQMFVISFISVLLRRN
ncbi:MAG: IS5 family transposase [Eubacteriaceae bacterium]|nr:IS5 family transposase [Eubacteriaceae bacterium]